MKVKKIKNISVSKPISYVEWHRNRDKMAQEQRNIEVHKKSLAGNSN
jgi:hypothetical protein